MSRRATVKEKNPVRDWKERAADFIVRCPRCTQGWFAVGAIAGAEHRCKACGCTFRVTEERG